MGALGTRPGTLRTVLYSAAHRASYATLPSPTSGTFLRHQPLEPSYGERKIKDLRCHSKETTQAVGERRSRGGRGDPPALHEQRGPRREINRSSATRPYSRDRGRPNLSLPALPSARLPVRTPTRPPIRLPASTSNAHARQGTYMRHSDRPSADRPPTDRRALETFSKSTLRAKSTVPSP